jgi:hypothetical protein
MYAVVSYFTWVSLAMLTGSPSTPRESTGTGASLTQAWRKP